MFNRAAPADMSKLLLCGLDFSGKTTLVKKFKGGVPENSSELIMTTPFLNLEKVTLPQNNT